MYLRRYWPDRLPVSLKSSTDIGEFIYRYWWNHLQVLAKSYTGIGQIVYWYWQTWQCIHRNYAFPYCQNSEIVYRYLQNCIPVLMKSFNKKTSWPFPYTSRRFCQYWYMILPMPVYNFSQYWYRISECQGWYIFGQVEGVMEVWIKM